MDHPEENRFPAAVDRYGQAASFEARLRALAERGFAVDLRVHKEAYGKDVGQVRFDVRLQKGEAYNGPSMSANGSGLSLDAATRAALRAAESFLRDPEPPAAVEAAMGDLIIQAPAISVVRA